MEFTSSKSELLIDPFLQSFGNKFKEFIASALNKSDTDTLYASELINPK